MVLEHDSYRSKLFSVSGKFVRLKFSCEYTFFLCEKNIRVNE